MKTLTTLIFCIVFNSYYKEVVTKSTGRTNLHELDQECYSNVNKSLLLTDDNGFLIEGNESVNEVMRCNWEKIGLLSATGLDSYKLQRMLEQHLKDNYNNYVGTYLASKTIQDCIHVLGKNPGDFCVKIYNCIFKRLDANIKVLEEEAE